MASKPAQEFRDEEEKPEPPARPVETVQLPGSDEDRRPS